MSIKKENFLLYHNMYPMFEELTDEEAGQIIKATFLYSMYNEKVDFKKGTAQSVVLKSIINSIDINTKKYTERCKSNRENALKRWSTIVFDNCNFTREEFEKYRNTKHIAYTFNEILEKEQELVSNNKISQLKELFNCNSLSEETIIETLHS